MSRYLCLICLFLAACAPTPAMPSLPTVVPFPTVTPGRFIEGSLSTPVPRAPITDLANPATAVAIASLPTPTPNYGDCPLPSDDAEISFGGQPIPSIIDFLSAGGSPVSLEQALLAAGFAQDVGAVRPDFDLTGEGVAEVIVSLAPPEGESTLLIFGCASGRYLLQYQVSPGTEAPEVLTVGDVNLDNRPELLFTAASCNELDGLCEYESGLITWFADDARFINLLNAGPDGDEPPAFGDVDNDGVQEIVMRQAGGGNLESGPLRTGSNIYDWNGSAYVLSLSQPDPIRYRIQAVHEADRAFREQRMDDAARLYLFSVNDTTLDYWYDGSDKIVRSYVLYRLLITYAFAENGDPLTTYQQRLSDYPNPDAAPVYARLMDVFWDTYQVTNNLRTACQDVQIAVLERPSALDLLNRYGIRNPTYTAQSLCPF